MAKGLLIVISGPSGAGKGTIYNQIMATNNYGKSISVTTRSPREGEVDGQHYHFKTVDEYNKLKNSGEFLEYAKVYDNHYGTLKAPIFDMINKGQDVIFEIDIEGAKQIKNIYPESVLIFIMTSSLGKLKERLVGRGSETKDSLKKRLGCAKDELKQSNLFDYIVFNEELAESIASVNSILLAEKQKININNDKINAILNSDFN